MGFLGAYKQKSLIKKGNKIYKQRKYKEALECYDKAQDLDLLNNLLVWWNKGIVFSKLKNYPNAIECYDKVLDLDPNHFASLV